MNRDDSDEQEDLLGDLLVRYDEALANDQEDPELERSLSEVDSGLAQEFEQVRECLELMDRLRRRWNPADTAATDKGGDSTPHAHAQRVPERPADQPDPATIQPRTIGRFGIERELGRGGLGIVYLATDPKLGRKVALKIPRVESLVDDEIRRRFLREAEAAARLMHPHILPIYEVGQDGMIHYIAAEYRPGCSLSTWIKGRSEPVDPRLAAEMAMLLAEAVQHAHSRGVLHRDIKPSNVLLGDGAEQDDRSSCLDSARSLHPKLTDFGMAKLMEREGDETRSGAIVGTPAYMAPEQAEGRVHDLDARTDIYGLGAVLYELLTGHPPFQGNTDVDTLRRLVSDEPQPPRAERSDVPHDLQAICLKCLAKRPEHRYQTAFGLANDLRRFLRGEPTRARPLNTWDRTWKWVRRRPALASACAVAAVATLLLTATAVNHHVEMERTLDELRLHAYATDMRVAADAWRNGNVEMLREKLSRYLPDRGGEDLRTFSWHYLWRQCHAATRTLAGHQGDAMCVAYSPTGDILASGGKSGHVRLWDPKTGTLLATRTRQGEEIHDVAFSPDGNWVCCACDDGTVGLWNIAHESSKMVVHTVSEEPLFAVAFSPQGRLLAIGDDAGLVHLIDFQTWSKAGTLAGHTDGIECLAFSPSGKWLVSGSDDYSAAIWDVATKELVRRLQHRFDTRRAKVTGVAFSSDGKTLATSIRESRKSSLWRVETGELLGTHEEHPEVLLGLARPRGRNEIVTACKDGVTRIVDLSTGKIIGKCLGHTNRVWDVATSRNGDELATASADGTVMLWDLDAVERSRHYWSLPRAEMNISFSPDGTSFGASTHPGRFYLWDTTTNALTWNKPTEASPSDSFACARFVFGPEGKSIAIGDSELSTVEVWDLPSGKRRLVIDCKAYVLAWHPSRSELATVEPLHVKFWDTNTGKQIGQIDTSNDSVPIHIEYSPDGRLLATRDRTFSVGAWRTDTRELISSIADTSTFYRWAFSPDGKILAMGRSNSQILLWNLPENRALGTLVGHKGDINDLAFSRDGNTLASAASDDSVRIWDMRTQQEVMHWPIPFPVRIAFSPNEKTLVVVSRESDAKSSLRIFSADSDEDAAPPPFSPEAP